MGFTLLSIGALAMDIILKTTRLPEEDGFSLVESEALVPGGSASNMSVAAVCCGMDAYQTGQIGDDHYGRLFLDSLMEAGVHTDHLLVRENGVTLHNFIVSTRDGRHAIFAHPGNAVHTMDPDRITPAMTAGIDAFYTDMFSADASLALARRLKGNVPILYNMQCGPAMMAGFDTPRRKLQTMLELATVLVVGRHTLTEWSGLADPVAAAEAIMATAPLPDGVICTQGENGAIWHTGEAVLAGAAFTVEAVESTGAGDSFIAGLIDARYRKKQSREHALRTANAAGALKCRQHGPRALFTPEELDAFIRDVPGGHITVFSPDEWKRRQTIGGNK